MKQTIKYFIVIALLASGCRTSEGNMASGTASTNSANMARDQAATNANEAQPRPPGDGANSSRIETPASLVGTFVLSEVHNKGKATVITDKNSTEITFRSNGAFSRTSRKDGQVDHSDSGEFRIMGRDLLVLKITVSKEKRQQPPVEKRHGFTLSPDGEELRMAGTEGKVAVFRRTRNIGGN